MANPSAPGPATAPVAGPGPGAPPEASRGDKRGGRGTTGTTGRTRNAGRTRWTGPRGTAALAALAFTAPAWAYVTLFYLYPLASNVLMGFQDYTVSSFYTGEAPFVGWQNYRAVYDDPQLTRTVLNTIGFTVGSLVFQFGIGMALAVFFRRKFPLGGVLRSLLLVPWLLPLVVSGTAWRWILDTDTGVLNQSLRLVHLIDTPVPWLASTDLALIAVTIVNIWVGIPFNMVILYGGLQSVPEELDEAAALDGAGPWQRFWRVTFPLLRPVTAVVLTLGLIYTIKVFDVIMVLTQGGPAGSSRTLTIFGYDLSFQELAFGKGAAVGNVLIAVAVIFAVLYVHGTRDTDKGARP